MRARIVECGSRASKIAKTRNRAVKMGVSDLNGRDPLTSAASRPAKGTQNEEPSSRR